MFHWGHARREWLLAHGGRPQRASSSASAKPRCTGVRHRCNDKLVRLLLDHGADPSIKNRDGKSACLLASQLKAWRILKLLDPPKTKTKNPTMKTTTKKGGRR